MKNSELIIQSLNQLFPDAKCELNHANHFELLIAVVLSAKADLKDVEQIIRPIGLYHNKAVNIIKLSKVLCEYYDGQVPSEREDLESLPGVGRKTANVILNNCFDVPAFAVDTHVSRVSKRLQIAQAEDDVKTIEEKLMTYFPKDKWGKLHHQFIFFGRYKCKAAKPDCTDCPLKGICTYRG